MPASRSTAARWRPLAKYKMPATAYSAIASVLPDPREVVTDPQARYFGIAPSERTLLPGSDARIAETRLEDWLKQATTAR